jgi:hypothetical protein
VFSWKERSIHSFIATQKRKKKSKRKENVLISFKKVKKNNQLYVLSNLSPTQKKKKELEKEKERRKEKLTSVVN